MLIFSLAQDLGGWRENGVITDFEDILEKAHHTYRLGVFFSWKVTQDLENPVLAIPSVILVGLAF